MKRIIFFCLLVCIAITVRAQSFTVNNTTSCDFYVNCQGFNSACATDNFITLQLVKAGKTLYYASPAFAPFAAPPPGMLYTIIQIFDCHQIAGPIVENNALRLCPGVTRYPNSGSGNAPSCGCISYNVSRSDDAFNNVTVTIY